MSQGGASCETSFGWACLTIPILTQTKRRRWSGIPPSRKQESWPRGGRLSCSKKAERDGQPLLPLTGRPKVYVEGIAEEVAGRYCEVVGSPQEAVRQQKEDLPYDSKDPLFEFGFGLTYQ